MNDKIYDITDLEPVSACCGADIICHDLCDDCHEHCDNIYETEDGTRIAARPSGTEPKVKFYISTNAKLDKAEDYKSVNSQLETKIEGILSELNL